MIIKIICIIFIFTNCVLNYKYTNNEFKQKRYKCKNIYNDDCTELIKSVKNIPNSIKLF